MHASRNNPSSPTLAVNPRYPAATSPSPPDFLSSPIYSLSRNLTTNPASESLSSSPSKTPAPTAPIARRRQQQDSRTSLLSSKSNFTTEAGLGADLRANYQCEESKEKCSTQGWREGGVGEKPETSERKRSKGKSCMQMQGRRVCRRRLLRQKMNEKFKALQELIPNCSKRGQASILDDAVKYIKNLQLQLQMMMSMRAVWSTFWPASAMIPQAGMQIPSLAPLLQITGCTDEMKHEIEMRTPDMLSASYFPVGLATYSSFLPPRPTLSYNQILQQSLPIRGGGSEATVLPTQIVLPPYDHVVVQDPQPPSESSEWYCSSDTETE